MNGKIPSHTARQKIVDSGEPLKYNFTAITTGKRFKELMNHLKLKYS